MKEKGTYRINIWMSTIAFIVSIGSICISVYRTNNLGFDYMGFLIGILALLVTLLLSWNIYSAIDQKSMMDKLKSIENNNRLNLHRNNAITYGTLSDFYSNNIGNNRLKHDYLYLLYSLKCIGEYARIEEKDEVDKCYLSLLSWLLAHKDACLSKKEKSELLEVLTEHRNIGDPLLFHDVLSSISLIYPFDK